jgi:hypothetical protein
MSLLLIEEFLDSIAVFAVVTLAAYWWMSSRISDAAIESDPPRRAKLKSGAATHAAVAAPLQAMAVLTNAFAIGSNSSGKSALRNERVRLEALLHQHC